MIIKEIILTNMELLRNFHKGLEDIKSKNAENGDGFHNVINTDIKPLLQRISIKVIFENANPFEALAIKKAATFSNIQESGFSTKPFNSESSPLYSKLDSILKGTQKIENFKHVENILPIGCLQYSGYCLLEGAAIGGLIKYSWEELFISQSEHTKDLDEDELLKWNISKGFVKLIHNIWRQELTGRDLHRDSYTDSTFYSKISDKTSFVLKEIRNHSGNVVKFIDTTLEKMQEAMPSLKNSEDTDFVVEFIAYTSLRTFFYLYFVGDYVEILDHFDYLRLASSNALAVDYGDTGDASIVEKQIIDLCKEAFEIPDFNIYEKYLCFPANRRIQYSFQVSLQKFWKYEKQNALEQVMLDSLNAKKSDMDYNHEYYRLGLYFHNLSNIFDK